MVTVSVIIPVYNVVSFIEKCVKSVLKQSFEDIEIILIDDGSTDGSSELCDDFALKDNRVFVIHKKNEGVSSARNIGIQVSRGKYLCFVDSDDWIEKNFIESLLQCFTPDTDIVACGVYVNKTEERNERLNIYNKTIVLDRTEAMKLMLLPEYFNGSLCNKMYKREVIEKYDILLDESISYCEDLLFTAQYFFHINRIVYYSYPLYHYRMRAGSAVVFGSHNVVATGIIANEKVLEMYKNADPELVRIIEANCACMAIRAIEALSLEKKYDKTVAQKYREHFLLYQNSYFSIYKNKQKLKGILLKRNSYALWIYFKIKREIIKKV